MSRGSLSRCHGGCGSPSSSSRRANSTLLWTRSNASMSATASGSSGVSIGLAAARSHACSWVGNTTSIPRSATTRSSRLRYPTASTDAGGQRWTLPTHRLARARHNGLGSSASSCHPSGPRQLMTSRAVRLEPSVSSTRTWISCVPERLSGLERDRPPQRDLHDQQRENERPDQGDRDVQGGKGEQDVNVQHVLARGCQGVREPEAERD